MLHVVLLCLATALGSAAEAAPPASTPSPAAASPAQKSTTTKAHAAAAAAVEESPTWENTIEKVVPAVVALRVTATRDFDTEDAGTTLGTGFVVDAEKGIILTNRHMVHAGPVIAEAAFLDHEEVELEPIYRDPIHDFGFYRFDPKAVKFMQVVDLPLVPEAAHVGMEIRVIGNDDGEKISILDGTLARLDRNAPDYGQDTYNDFNTFYLQAASNTAGGSSGSPVVDIQGRVVGLNAGGSRQSASSFYLPLDRVVEAFQHIEKGEPIPRGTLETVFSYTSYDEVRRLGLDPDVEKDVRKAFPTGTGMLVVDDTVPDGPGWKDLQSGDVLVRVNGKLCTSFVQLEDVLDDDVGKTVDLVFDRGGQPMKVTLPIEDLYRVSPSSFLEISRSVLHDVSLTQARNRGVPAKGVYVAVPGHWLSVADVPEGAVITDVDDAAVADLDAMQKALESKADGQRVRLKYHTVDDPRHDKIAVARIDRLWFPMQRCTLDPATGRWPCVASPPPPAAKPAAPETASTAPASTRVGKLVAPSLVMVDFDVPHPTSGLRDFNYVGTGVVVDAGKGLVFVDRDTVPTTLGDMTLTFGGSVRVPGKVVYLHPEHDFAIVQYDPKLLGDTPVRAVDMRDRIPQPGDKIWQVGMDQNQAVASIDTTVESVDPILLGVSSTPRFRDFDVEGISVRESAPTLGGVLCDDKGRVVAMWASFVDQDSENRMFVGLPVRYVAPIVAALHAGETPQYRSLGAELAPISLADARDRGLSEDRAAELAAHDPDHRRVLEVVRTTGGTPASTLLKAGDLVIEANHAPITRLLELEPLTAMEQVPLRVLRDGKELDLALPTVPLDGHGVDVVVSWAGMILHAPHLEVAEQQGIAPDGVYIAWLWYGSPAARYQLRPTRRIVEVDGVPTPDLEHFLQAVAGEQDRQSVRVKMLGLDGKVQVATMKLDLQYWPTQVLERGEDGKWSRRHVGPESSTATK